MEINIKQLFLILIKKIPIILASAIIFGVLSFTYTKLMITPLYSSSAMLSIQANENRESYKSVSSGDYTVSIELVSTISELVKNEACLNIVGKVTGLNKTYSTDQLKGMVSISTTGTENFRLRISCPNPEHSLVLANAFADVISDSTFVNGNIVNADEMDPNRGYIKKILKAGTVTLISGAKNIPMSPSSPNVSKNTVLGLIIGAAIVAAFYILKEILNNKVFTEEDIEDLFPEIPALGSIPVIALEKGSEDNA